MIGLKACGKKQSYRNFLKPANHRLQNKRNLCAFFAQKNVVRVIREGTDPSRIASTRINVGACLVRALP